MAEQTKQSRTLLSVLPTDEFVSALVSDLRRVTDLAGEMSEQIAKRQLPTRPATPLPEMSKMKDKLTTAIEQTGSEMREKTKQRSEVLQRNVELRQKRLEAYAKRKRPVVTAKGDKFVVGGQVVDKASGRGIPNLSVKAIDKDRKYDDLLGATQTDALGYYRIEYSEADFKDIADKTPETFIEVLDDKQQVLYRSTQSFIQKAGKTEKIDAQIDGSKVADKLALGQNVNHFVDQRLDRFEHKRQVMEGRKKIATEKIRPAVRQKIKPGLKMAVPRAKAVEKAAPAAKQAATTFPVEEAQVKEAPPPVTKAVIEEKKPLAKKAAKKTTKKASKKTTSKKPSKKKK